MVPRTPEPDAAWFREAIAQGRSRTWKRRLTYSRPRIAPAGYFAVWMLT
jgi:hypothetical protein